MLYTITLIVNLLFLIAAVWLGVYIVTRSPWSGVAWLTGLTLWSLAGLFLNVLLALSPPLRLLEIFWWFRLLIPFWPKEALESGAVAWLQGWLVVPALAFWYHATVLMLPGRMNRWRILRVIFVYIVALVAILVQTNSSLILGTQPGDPLYLNSMQPGALFLLFIALLLLFTMLCVFNLRRSELAAPPGLPKKQFNILVLATVVAGLVGPVGILGARTGVPVPMVVLSFLLGITVSMLGYGVARYSAVMEGQNHPARFPVQRRRREHNLAGLPERHLVVRPSFNVPPSAYVFVVVLAIVTHSVIDIARLNLDKIFYQQENRQLRAHLRKLASLVGEFTLEENLKIALESVCLAVRASYGLILIFKENGNPVTIPFHWPKKIPASRFPDLLVDDVSHVTPGQFSEPLSDAALLVPFYDEKDQIGALILGRPVNGTRYSVADVELLLYPSDQMVDAILLARYEKETMHQLAELTQVAESRVEKVQDQIPVKEVEKSHYATCGIMRIWATLRWRNCIWYTASCPKEQSRIWIGARLSIKCLRARSKSCVLLVSPPETHRRVSGTRT